MKKTFSVLLIAIFSFGFLSFSITRQELVGTWRWLHVENLETDQKIDVSELTMGMAKEVRTQFNEDNSYQERKTNSKNNSVSTTEGKWQLEEEGSVLSMMFNGKTRPSKIVSFKNDTLIVEMRNPLNLVMVKEK